MPQTKKDTSKNTIPQGFESFGLPEEILRAVQQLGYEAASPIQQQAIPALLEERDIIGQAQTGTGKTAAFALPLLSRIDAQSKQAQLLVLAPTRELAIQVAEACQQYAKHLRKVSILPIYGGQSYSIQLKQLNRGAQVIVGTPGRVMDLIKRKALSLQHLKALVLDEADEMLRMGFIDDVKWILEQSPKDRQVALFSATMPTAIKKVAERYIPSAQHIKIASKTATADNIEQRYFIVKANRKLDAITRLLEFEPTDGTIVFVRTKNATIELADRLKARGFASEALNGDIPQANREKIVDRLRKGRLDILVATDVVARGLDVERISHVINYDAPHDRESYIHRIGRTGRAGKSGTAILFITPREKRMLKDIERTTKSPLEALSLPSVEDINQKRLSRFKQQLISASNSKKCADFLEIIAQIQQETELSSEQIAAAACVLSQDNPLQFQEAPSTGKELDTPVRSDKFSKESKRKHNKSNKPEPDTKAIKLKQFPDIKMQRFKIAVGWEHGVKPSNIVGAIANEADLSSQYIGHIEIRDAYSTVDLPADMPKEITHILKKARVAGQPLKIQPYKKQKT